VRGILYIVSTPIGNLEDITLRALRVLKEVDLIAAEDTRHTQKLLTHYSISKPLISYWGAKEKVKAEEVLRHLAEGKSVALVTDAGTPGISDPGVQVVKRATEEGFEVIPIPGPSAVTAALSVSGLSGEFLFIGFLPPKRTQRVKKLEELKYERRTLVFYEAPHRLLDTLADMLDVFGNRYTVLCHELTKLNESIYRGDLKDVYESLLEEPIAGEYVLVIEGRVDSTEAESDAVQEVLKLMRQGMRRKDAVKKIARQYGMSQKSLYDQTLKEVTNET
jgi:16S rRNA (cytidine1402-2'-O)-methyltransferase